MSSHAEASRNKLEKNMKAVVTEMEDLLKATAGEAGEKIQSVRGRVEEALESLRGKMEEFGADALANAKATAKTTDLYVHENPWPVIGVAAGLGLIVGWLIGRK